MTQFRMNKCEVWVGQRGSGKTTMFRKKVEPHIGKKLLIIDTLDHDKYRDITIGKPSDLKRWESGKLRIIVDDFDELFYEMQKHLRNAVVLMEDCYRYLGEMKLPKEVKAFIIESKQRNLDMVFMVHAFGYTYLDFFRLCDSMVLFKTKDTPEMRKKHFPDYHNVCRIHAQIQGDPNPFAAKKITLS